MKDKDYFVSNRKKDLGLVIEAIKQTLKTDEAFTVLGLKEALNVLGIAEEEYSRVSYRK